MDIERREEPRRWSTAEPCTAMRRGVDTGQGWDQESCLDYVPQNATKPVSGDPEWGTRDWQDARGEGNKKVNHQKRAELMASLS